MRHILAFTLAASLAPMAQAAPVILDFAGNICGAGGDQACAPGAIIGQTYGDIAGQLDVVYDASRSAAGTSNLYYWDAGYETLANVAYGDFGAGGLSILFQPLAGFMVTVFGFDIAPYASRVTDTLVQVIDTATNSLLVNQGFTPLPSGEVTQFSGSWTSASGIQINLGPDAWDVGISNISYSVAPVGPDTPSPVPLPAAGWLMLAGLGGLGAIARRRRTAA
ncbi:VPLPA-CTERM sorting domain-containing protein [Pseudotabrizicola sediminis]|uniref:VPLPA-CTERM sorting domain-containing protein n=1 Tax=Pseudotabrizicola sediminis TaxID=2486418 RepID=A0ABY2KR39_9RHOB|nr:VPLPA-CTERM sorting domain-containing protein [Pseudotabrizicola sediminis]TGD45200.1 VPLPA-CTERM sorting domain-containing protein [Pseudotabrizicola sediminis]